MKSQIKILKQEIRGEFLKKRRNLDPDLAKQWSDRVQTHILASEAFEQAGVLALYAAFDNEVALDRIFQEASQEGKKVLFPRLRERPGEMDFCPVRDPLSMRPNRFGILEPREQEEPVSLNEIDFILVPGVAYDYEGFRLGMGRGYYDRILAKINPETKSMGIAYSIQLAESLPSEAKDKRVNLLVTEEGFLHTSGEESSLSHKGRR